MNNQAHFPKRLIEVDLPIRRISEHARREKSIRHGHIATLHIWWARRPLAACRAVLCASLWPDPADEHCPDKFRLKARELMLRWSEKHVSLASHETYKRMISWQKDRKKADNNIEIRKALLDFIADFADWGNTIKSPYLETARALTLSAHESLFENSTSKPIVVDPFAGGGTIPLEGLRIGADSFASDLNPVAVLLNKVALEYIPKYGKKLADEVRKWGLWVKDQAEKEIGTFFPKDPDGSIPIAYLWARSVKCEGPGCGAAVPLIRSLWLAKKGARSVGLNLIPNNHEKKISFEIIENLKASQIGNGTVARGSASCPVCGYTTPVARVREQMKLQKGGADHSRLFCVVTTFPGQQGRKYRIPNEKDYAIFQEAKSALERLIEKNEESFPLVPEENLPVMSGVFNAPIYGMTTWGRLFNSRQALGLAILSKWIRKLDHYFKSDIPGLVDAVQTCLALSLDKQADSNSSLCAWRSTSQDIGHTFGRQALPMVWDYVEANIFSGATRDWLNAVEGNLKALTSLDEEIAAGNVQQASATNHPLPDSSVQVFFTDPPYYNAVPYADLSDFFYVWLKRNIVKVHPNLFSDPTTPKAEECCEMAGWDPVRYSQKDGSWFEKQMKKAMSEGCRVLHPNGIGVVVFAHKSTKGWEAQMQAMVDAGWIITGSWAIDTEMGTRLRALNSAALASSVHLVCRPRGSDHLEVGDWRRVLAELPSRIHDWMPRLAEEGIVGADAIFACLGPALEIFSRYSSVEKASGDVVSLKEFLEHVWSAVAKEALNMIFTGADTSGFEEDSRLTAMWLWTLNGGGSTSLENGDEDTEETEDENEENESKGQKSSGFILEYDAARKIAQGLGAHLEQLATLVEVKADKARLIPVAERTKALFGKDQANSPVVKKPKKVKQLSFEAILGELAKEEPDWGEKKISKVGNTVLDRLHQTMILFAANRNEAMKRFLVEDGIGRDDRFWRLAQALSALYPPNTDEKRWVDGVLARKKSLGF